MRVPIGSDEKSIYHGTINFTIEREIKPRIRQLLRLVLALRDTWRKPGLLKYIRVIKGLVKILILAYQLRQLIVKKLPKPTLNNTIRSNTHYWIKRRDNFFANENNPNRTPEFTALWSIFLWGFEALSTISLLIFDGDYYYWERGEYEVAALLAAVETGDYALWQEPPRATWWGHDALCPNCGQTEGSPRAFADCPIDLHSN